MQNITFVSKPANPNETADLQGTIYLLDDDDSVRQGLQTYLQHKGYDVVTFSSAILFLELAQLQSPCAVLLDMRMPQYSGLEVQKALHESHGDIPVVFMSGESESHEIVKAMKLGAVDFLLKPFQVNELLEVLQLALLRSEVNGLKRESHEQAITQIKLLTPREIEISHWIIQAYSNQQIAHHLGIAPATVKLHRANILEKLNVHSLPALIAILPRSDDAFWSLSRELATTLPG